MVIIPRNTASRMGTPKHATSSVGQSETFAARNPVRAPNTAAPSTVNVARSFRSDGGLGLFHHQRARRYATTPAVGKLATSGIERHTKRGTPSALSSEPHIPIE